MTRPAFIAFIWEGSDGRVYVRRADGILQETEVQEHTP